MAIVVIGQARHVQEFVGQRVAIQGLILDKDGVQTHGHGPGRHALSLAHFEFGMADLEVGIAEAIRV
jgi:hypothetical protein